jgi:methionine synthase II (cobalamin-independent)
MVNRIMTTTIGSFPKPAYVPVRDWFESHCSKSFDAFYFESRDLETRFALATQASVTAQVEAEIDVPTDGEMRREHCIHWTGSLWHPGGSPVHR